MFIKGPVYSTYYHLVADAPEPVIFINLYTFLSYFQ